MKKQTLILLGIVAVAGFYAWKKGLFGKKAETTEPETKDEESKGETTPGKPGTAIPGTSAPATIIDVTKGNISVPEAIDQAKSIVEKYKGLKVLIKTPPGQKNISVSTKKKKPKTKRSKKAIK